MAEQVGAIEVKASLNTRDYTSGADKIDKDNKRIEKSSDGVQKSNGKLGKSFANLGKVAAVGIAAIGAGLTAIAIGSLKSFGESQAVMAQTDAVIKSTGGSAGLAAKEIADLASSLQKVTRFSDETIQTGENMLLTFTNIGKEVFPQATKTMLDMAQAMGGDVKGTAIQLGKALNDPTKGITALTRVGVTFTEAQKEQIKTLQESGDVIGAQTIVLKELQKEFGGSAEAAGKTLPGQLDILKNRFDNVMESLGGAIAGSGVLNGLANILGKVGDALEKIDFAGFIKGIKDSDITKGLVDGFKIFMDILNPLIKIIKDVFTELSKNKEVMDGLKIIVLVTAAALGALILVGVAFIGILGLIGAGIATVVSGIGRFVSQVVAGFQLVVKKVGEAKDFIVRVFSLVPGHITRILSRVGSLFSNTFNGIKNFAVNAFNGIVNFVRGIPGKIIGFFSNVGHSIGNAIRNAINSILNLPLRLPSITIGGTKFGGQTLIPRLAEGGIVSSATLAMVGEGKEPEAVIPLSKLESMLSGNFTGMGGNGTTVGTIIINRDVDIDLVAQKLGIKQLNAARGVS